MCMAGVGESKAGYGFLGGDVSVGQPGWGVMKKMSKRVLFVWRIKKKCIFAFESGVWVKGVWRCIVLKTKRKRK